MGCVWITNYKVPEFSRDGTENWFENSTEMGTEMSSVGNGAGNEKLLHGNGRMWEPETHFCRTSSPDWECTREAPVPASSHNLWPVIQSHAQWVVVHSVRVGEISGVAAALSGVQCVDRAWRGGAAVAAVDVRRARPRECWIRFLMACERRADTRSVPRRAGHPVANS